jgi:hypothetical protein
MMALFHELEEDVGLLRFYVDVPQLVNLRDAQRKSTHVDNSVMFTRVLALRQNPLNRPLYST